MIVVNLDVMMARRKMTLSQLSEKVDITLANLSILKNNKAKAVRFSTLEAICAALDCQPGRPRSHEISEGSADRFVAALPPLSADPDSAGAFCPRQLGRPIVPYTETWLSL